MSGEGYVADAKRLLEMLDRAFPERDADARCALLAVALGLRLGTVTYPEKPYSRIIEAGSVIGGSAAWAQLERTRNELKQCAGSA